MRKYILLLFVGLFLLSGCGNKEVVCTGEEDLEGENVKAEIVAKLEDDKVDSVSATMTFDSEDSANQMCSIFDLYNSSIENDDYKLSNSQVDQINGIDYLVIERNNNTTLFSGRYLFGNNGLLKDIEYNLLPQYEQEKNEIAVSNIKAILEMFKSNNKESELMLN